MANITRLSGGFLKYVTVEDLFGFLNHRFIELGGFFDFRYLGESPHIQLDVLFIMVFICAFYLVFQKQK